MNDSHENVLPEAVRKQVAAADEIIDALNKSGTPADPPAEPTPDPAKPANDPANPPTNPPANPPAEPTPDPAKPANDPAKPERTDWKHKYSVLKGKYDTEVPRLHDDLRSSTGMIRTLQEQLGQLQTTVASLQEVNKKPDDPAPPLVSQEEIDQFGPDLIDVVKRVAKQVVAPYVDKKVGEVQSSVKQVNENVASTQKDVAESARERLYERLDDAVPGWETINSSPDFTGWLRETDVYSGQPRGVLLRMAFERNDAERVVKIFKGFQKEHAVETSDPDPAAPQDPADPPADPPAEPQQTLDELVAPGTPKTGSTGAQEGSGKGRIWNTLAIQELYTERNEWIKANPNKDMPERLVLLERDLAKAQREGRVRG